MLALGGVAAAPLRAGLPEVVAATKPSVMAVGLYNPLASPRFTFRGTGFVVGDGPPRSLGLAGMVERASLIGGHVEIASTPAEGTTVVLEVPR